MHFEFRQTFRVWTPLHFYGPDRPYKMVGQTINMVLIMVVSYRSTIGIVIHPPASFAPDYDATKTIFPLP